MKTTKQMMSEVEDRFHFSNPTAIQIKFDWTCTPRIVTYPTGLRAYYGEFRACAAGYVDRPHSCGFNLDGSFSYFN